METAFEAIEKEPLRFPLCDDMHRWNRVDRFPYIIAYRMTGDHPLVVAIRHAAQDQIDFNQR